MHTLQVVSQIFAAVVFVPLGVVSFYYLYQRHRWHQHYGDTLPEDDIETHDS